MKLNYYKIITLLAIFGICLALYLFYEFLAPAHTSLCYVNSTINCEASTKGTLATLLGIPVPLYGLAGYIFILLSAVKKWPKFLLGVATFGLVFCLRITVIEIFQLHVLCPVCLLCQLDMVAVFLLAVLVVKRGDTK